MNNIAGDSWFPVTGNLILNSSTPICSVPNEAQAYMVMEALTHWNKGQPFTCVSSTGWYCKQIDDKPEQEESQL